MASFKQGIHHFKLTTGEEVIAEVLDTSDRGELICRKVLKLSSHPHQTQRHTNVYTFRPYMIYQENPTAIILIHSQKVVAQAKPTWELIEQWKYAIEDMERLREIEEAANKLKDAADLAKHLARAVGDDSDVSNIVPFPSKPEIH